MINKNFNQILHKLKICNIKIINFRTFFLYLRLVINFVRLIKCLKTFKQFKPDFLKKSNFNNELNFKMISK